jgi:CO/xanthine dehydrogenase Mo-binding subunit
MTSLQMTTEAASIFDEPEYRVEGPLKVTGRARYTADVRLPGALCAKFLFAPVAHARIVSIDTAAAKAMPGVHAVLTGQDIGPRRFGRQLFDWPVLAYERVLHIGERVAAVAAETRETADEALTRIHVEYEELPAVFDFEQALSAEAPILHPDPSDYYYLSGERPPRPHLNLQGYRMVTKGEEDIERVFARADHVFEDVYTGPKQHQGYIEPHACVVWIDPDGTVRVYSTNKAPFSLRHQLSVVTGLPAQSIVVDSMFIGGDFGGKGHTIEEFPCYFLAKATGRPIKATMTYSDELGACNPRHDGRIYLRTAVSGDGRIIAHQSRAYYNGGAYGGAKPTPGCMVPTGFSPMQVYNVPNTSMETFVVYTNTVPSGHMRAPGATLAALAGEEHVDHMARELGIDPLEFRLRNALREGDTGPQGEAINNPRAVEVLEAVRRETGWGEKLPPNHGRGIALRHRDTGQGKTEILLRLLPNGRIEALYGTPDQGSGSATVVWRVAASVLSVEPELIQVRYGSTSEAPPDPGAGASRVTHIVGRATILAATRMKEQLEDLAAEVMGWPAGQVRLEGSEFRVPGSNSDAQPAQRASFEEVAARIARGAPVEVLGEFDSQAGEHKPEDASFYACVVEVEVDPDTGRVRPVDAVMAVDVGTIINPIAHQGQLEGSFAYGYGNAMMEELAVEDGKVTTLSLGEYKLPTEMDVPPLRTILVPTDVGPGPFGAKAAGEITNSGVTPAFANAVRDAIGVRIKAHPITAERVYTALKEQPARTHR